MRKIAVCISKGGVGKTTTAVNLSAGLAMTGSKVILIETDTQDQAGTMLGLSPEAGLAEVVSGELKPMEAMVQARDNLWLMAGGRTLAGVKRMISRKDYGGENALKEALYSLDGEYDYIILDTAPGWDSLTVNVLFYAKEVLVPVSLELLTLKGLLSFIENIAEIQRYNKKLILRYILPTFMDGRVRKSSEILRQLQTYYKKQLCSPIRYNVRLSEAPGYGQTIYEYAPNSTGAEDYKKLTERIWHDK
jgi:chromosome partitioning protein